MTTLPPFGPMEGQKWFGQISSEWESKRNRFALISFGKIQVLPPCIWNLPFMSYLLWCKLRSAFRPGCSAYVYVLHPPSSLKQSNSIITLGYSRCLDGVDRPTNPLPRSVKFAAFVYWLQVWWLLIACTFHVPKFLWIFFVRLSTTIHIFVRHFLRTNLWSGNHSSIFRKTIASSIIINVIYLPPKRDQK
jgi:hypothetical protein